MSGLFWRKRREALIRECLATFPEGIAYPTQVARQLGLPYATVNADMRRMSRNNGGIHVIEGYRRRVATRV
jgi:hypothetical protein